MTARGATAGLAALGALISAYLTWVHYSGGLALCTGAAGCETVQASRYAVVGGVPVALLGLAAYVVLLGLALWRPGPAGAETRRLVLFGVALAGTLYSAYLSYLELGPIGAVCPWCATSAVLMLAILALSVRELVRDRPN
jgi:uncharacterized membrane protein